MRTVLRLVTHFWAFSIIITACAQKKDSPKDPKGAAADQTKSVEKPKTEANTLPSVKIVNQTWATENLSVTTFRNGDSIPQAQSAEEWKKAKENGTPAWCYYEGNAENGKLYGILYNWYAVNDPRGLAPAGWHIPSDEEWTALTTAVGGDMGAGKKLKHNQNWKVLNDGKSGNGTNEVGFKALPGGYRYDAGNFAFVSTGGYWWTSTAQSDYDAWRRSIGNSTNEVARNYYSKNCGYSVRCIKD